MDDNYVRMRKALKDGDLATADEYKLLYEAGKVKKRVLSVLDYAIAILLLISVLLGIYILHSEDKTAKIQNETVKTEVAQ